MAFRIDKIPANLVPKIMNKHNMILELNRSTKRKPEGLQENCITFKRTDLF